jgi:hypothetical protein
LFFKIGLFTTALFFKISLFTAALNKGVSKFGLCLAVLGVHGSLGFLWWEHWQWRWGFQWMETQRGFQESQWGFLWWEHWLWWWGFQ